MASYVEIARQFLADIAQRRTASQDTVVKLLVRPDEGEPIETLEEPTAEQLAHASTVLSKAGIRLMRLYGVDMVGIWSDLDSPRVRAALRTYGSDQLPVRYLDGDVLMKYKLRKAPGEPVPGNVLAAMEQAPNEPWIIRDRMLAEMGWTPHGILWAKWKAQSLNKVFKEHGVTGQAAKITAAVIRHGERGTGQ